MKCFCKGGVTRISLLHGCYVVSVLITLESCFLVLQPVVSLDHLTLFEKPVAFVNASGSAVCLETCVK